MTEATARKLPPRPPYLKAVIRGFFLRCPRCGVGPTSERLLKMYPACSNCGQAFKLKAGEFTGGAYLGYFLTVFIVALVFLLLIGPFKMGYEQSLWVLVPLGAAIPFLTHRNTVGMFMGMLIANGAMDYFADTSGDERSSQG
ncbi:hypothetical protein D3C87_1179340 [compost metagenome]